MRNKAAKELKRTARKLAEDLNNKTSSIIVLKGKTKVYEQGSPKSIYKLLKKEYIGRNKKH